MKYINLVTISISFGNLAVAFFFFFGMGCGLGHGGIQRIVLHKFTSYPTSYYASTYMHKSNGVAVVVVNVYYVMGFRPNYFTCTAHLYLYYTLLVPYTYASYIRH